EEALTKRRADAEKYGSFRRSVFAKRMEKAVLVTCKKYGEDDIGFDQNTQHQCTIETEKEGAILIKLGARGATQNFTDYCRVLYLRDLLNHPKSLEYINDSDLREMGIYSEPACEFLIDEAGVPLATLSSGIDLETVGEEVIWRRMDTAPHVLLACALDVAARTTAEQHDEEQAKRGGNNI
ncbi:hypothetical protein M408DRAFT_31224, partial [Serendipita vermifera MAFF 305830]